jgi:uncharacterized protein (TIGR03032 family)
VTTYQAQQLLVMRAFGDGVSMLVRSFDKPMGLAVDGRRIALGTRDRVWLFRNAPDIARQLVEPAGQIDACYLPRMCYVSGDIAGHELCWAGEEIWAVNTRFSCLCTLHPDYSFVPRWRPRFVTALAAEDRCHLNGLAMAPGEKGLPDARYVTALAQSDVPQGWRPLKSQGGCVLDVPSGELVSDSLCMPHSPRLHEGRLWLLESGTGRFLVVHPANGKHETITQLPGYVRGLALSGPYAFIGLSKIRASSDMDGVPLAQQRAALKCGVAVVDLRHGRIVAGLDFQTAVEEIFDVQLVPGVLFPEVVGFQKATVQNTFVIPDLNQCSGICA